MSLVTFVAGNVLEAQQLNDSFAAVNVVKAINSANVATSQSTTSATFTDLATTGPTVTVTTGTDAIVIVSCKLTCNTNTTPRMGFAVSGATTIAAADASATAVNTTGADGQLVLSTAIYRVTLTAGSNTFTAKYRSGNTATFADRWIYVVTL